MFFSAIWILSILSTGFAQREPDKATSVKKVPIENLLRSRHFMFTAQNANPMRGPVRALTTPYELKITGDSLQCDLPYYGQVYSLPINPNQNVLEFLSTKFSYSLSIHRMGRYELNIQPRDNQEVQQLNFTVYENGSAYLNVNFANRDAITFNGIIQQLDKGR